MTIFDLSACESVLLLLWFSYSPAWRWLGWINASAMMNAMTNRETMARRNVRLSVRATDGTVQ